MEEQEWIIEDNFELQAAKLQLEAANLKLKNNIALLCNNTIRVVAFVVLAILFDCWWISLASILVMSYHSDK